MGMNDNHRSMEGPNNAVIHGQAHMVIEDWSKTAWTALRVGRYLRYLR